GVQTCALPISCAPTARCSTATPCSSGGTRPSIPCRPKPPRNSRPRPCAPALWPRLTAPSSVGAASNSPTPKPAGSAPRPSSRSGPAPPPQPRHPNMNLSLPGLALLLFATTLAAEIPAKQPWHRHQGYGSVGLETTDHALIQTIKPGMTFDRLEAEIGSKPARIPGASDIALYCTTISEAAYEVAVLDNGTETVLGISYKLLRSAPNASTWSEPRNFHTPFDPDF